MKAILLSTGFAAAMGIAAMAPANAAPIATRGVVAAPAVTTDVACRIVKRVVYSRGVKRVTTTRQCTSGPRYYGEPRRYYGAPHRYYGEPGRYYGERRSYYRAPRPGITVRIR